ncbi:hypothetical protein ATANTOWER_030183, partial [Ataeniobius toweri]|nr:hypothetical protein [Ataeniobius toweri]
SHSLSFPAAQFLTCYHFHLIACLPLSLVHTPPPSVYKLVCLHNSSLVPHVSSLAESLDVFWSVVAVMKNSHSRSY